MVSITVDIYVRCFDGQRQLIAREVRGTNADTWQPQLVDGATELGDITLTTSHYTGMCFTSGKAKLNAAE